MRIRAICVLGTFLLPAAIPRWVAAEPTRRLICRGGPQLQISTLHNPSPRSTTLATVALTYRRSTRLIRTDHTALEPGTCTWNPYGDPKIPAEPGFVHFDVSRTGSRTIPDPRNVGVYLGSEQHYWSFYVDDARNIAISHGPYAGTFLADYPARDTSRTASAIAGRREELRCRGGQGLTFTRGSPAGANELGMTLTYAAAPAAAGPDSRGLAPGTCAWVNRAGAAAEPGRIAFVTAGNAQLKQIQSGSAVDRSITAAERWPDVATIPRYLSVATHYWRFNVSLADPDTAIGHAAWKREPGGDTYGAGKSQSSQVHRSFDIRNVQVTPGLEGVVIRFDAPAGIRPTVLVSGTPPGGNPGSVSFGGHPIQLAVSAAAGTGMVRYTAASNTALARGTPYWFIIGAPETANARANQSNGQFRTLAQYVTLGVTEIVIVSDSDDDGNGELWFSAQSCPGSLGGFIVGTPAAPVSWSEGRHKLDFRVTSPATNPENGSIGPSMPDRFRVLIAGEEDDWDGPDFGPSSPVVSARICNGGDLQPGSNDIAEWNSVLMDLDVSKYPGTKHTETFIRRSKPLRNGSKLAFEVRGYIMVERK